jgi:glycosyltransferase involved in cell wall biosynthesis
MAWSRVDRMLSVSSRLAERLAAATGFPLQRIHVIRNGVDLSRFGSIDRTAARRTLGIADEALVIGTAGRLVGVKDHATLLEAFAELARRRLPFVGLITGDGPLRANLEARAASLGILDHVRFLGHRPDIERIFAALDIFVLSSISEGLSNTVLEAMASGLPVVATRVGGADELVCEGATGFLVEPGSGRALANALEPLVREHSRRIALGREGQRVAREQFSVARMLHDYAAMYRRLETPRYPVPVAQATRSAVR